MAHEPVEEEYIDGCSERLGRPLILIVLQDVVESGLELFVLFLLLFQTRIVM